MIEEATDLLVECYDRIHVVHVPVELLEDEKRRRRAPSRYCCQTATSDSSRLLVL
jgi:hypothetical protein